MTRPRGVVILHPVAERRELTDPELAEALAVDERRRAAVLTPLREVIAVLAEAMAARYEP